MSHCGKSMNTLEIFFLHCYTSSISMLFNNFRSFEHRMAKISMIQSVLWPMWRTTAHPRPWQNCRCTCRLPRHPQDGGSKRSTPGALPLETTTFKREFVAQTTSLSGCEPQGRCSAANGSAAADEEAATGEPGRGRRHKDNLIFSRPSVSCFCNEWLISNSSAPAGCNRPGAGRNKAVAPNIIWT